jgi:hypothetical protein
VLHYFIACVVAAVYFAATVKIPALNRRPIRNGLLFGAAVYLFMNYLVLPFSAVSKTPFSWGLFFNGIIGHALFIGVPIAVFAAAPRAREIGRARAGRPLAA